MEKWAESLLSEWEFTRSCTKAFINGLSDEELDRRLPRKGLDTFRKHFQEMIEVQRDYVAAIDSRVMQFSGKPDAELDGLSSKEKLLADMAEADASLHSALEGAGDSYVQWFGEKRLLPYHIAVIISHESMHIGQIIAFCYALDIDIPHYVVENWALSGK